MNVLLLEHPRGRSKNHFNDIANTPLSSCLISGYIASLLQANGIETEILDTYLSRYSIERMVEEVVDKECDILGIHLVYSWEHTPTVLDAIDEIGLRIEVPIVAYGFYPTFAYDCMMRSHRSFDYTIIGEPEFTFFEFCSQLKKGEDLKAVDGLAIRSDGDSIVYNKRKVVDGLDQMPFPYRSKEHIEYIGGNILGSRGCYGNCTFCYINNFYGERCLWRGRTPDNIYHEAQNLLSCISSRYIYFIDANFFGPGEEGQCRAEGIAERLQNEKGLEFGLECRVDNVQERSLKALAHAGLKDVFIGVESGSKSSLKRIRKGTTVEQGIKAIDLLRHYGIEPHIGFIMFESDSTLRDIRDNFNFLYDNHLLKKLTTTVDLLYHPQIVLMGTDSYKALLQENRMSFPHNNVYKGTFAFKDARVQFMSDVISPICHHILMLMDKQDSPIYWCRNGFNNNQYSCECADRLNQWLVVFFDDLLKRLEYGEIMLTDELKNQYINESVSLISEFIPDSLIPEEPLYQQP